MMAFAERRTSLTGHPHITATLGSPLPPAFVLAARIVMPCTYIYTRAFNVSSVTASAVLALYLRAFKAPGACGCVSDDKARSLPRRRAKRPGSGRHGMADSEATSHCLDQSADRKTQGPAVLRLVSVESCSGGEHSYHFASNRVPILVIMDCVVCDKGKYHVLLYINA